MPLQPPKRTAAGFFVTAAPPPETPEIRWTTEGHWAGLSGEAAVAWMSWADSQRNSLLGELLGHGNWFSRPPRRDILDPLFSPWISRSMTGAVGFACKLPGVPGVPGESSGRATWKLEGLLMNGTGITPVWSVASATPDESLDRISLFGDGDSDSGSEDGCASTAEGLREIQLEEIEDAPALGGPPAQIRSREWEARKFLAKERVREARLKAQIARHLAAKEEDRFYRQFGDLEDAESHFSDYDLSDTDSEGSGSGSSADEDGVTHV
jgi:hypothetical protein